MPITKFISYVKSIRFIRRSLTSTQTRSTYSSRVSFDTFDNRDAPELSYVLTHKHKDFVSSKRSRLFLCGTDQNDYSDFALEWLLDELVDDGDEVVCFRVVDKDSKINSDTSLEQRRYKEEAHKLMEHIKSKNKDHEKSINLVLEFAVGKVQESIQNLVCVGSLYGTPTILSPWLILHRLLDTHPLVSSLALVASLLAVFKVYYLDPFQSTAFRTHPSLLLLCVHLRNAKRKSGNVARIPIESLT